MKQRILSLLVILLVPTFVFAAGNKKIEPVGHTVDSSSAIEWQPTVDNESITLTISLPDGSSYAKTFASGKAPNFRVQDLPKAVDGTYSYELRVTPRISAGVKQQLAAAREEGDDATIARIQRENGLLSPTVQTGSFSVKNGALVPVGGMEPAAHQATPAPGLKTGENAVGATSTPKFTISSENNVIADNLIVQGSECIGFDCSTTETFGFETLKMKENNTRILFDDTSTSTGYPANDWQLVANDSGSGGANYFAIEDVTGAKTPFTVTAGAPTASMFVDSTGRLGLRTNSPGLDIDIKTGNTPAVRLQQDNTGGFTAQTWDMGANEANFFIRDVTGGSRLPFRIRPGAPTSSIDIAASGFVGVGTASPQKKMHIIGASGANTFPSSAFGTADTLIIDNAGNSNLGFVAATTGQSIIRFVKSAATAASGAITYDYPTDAMSLSTAGSTWVRIGSTGNLGLGGAAVGTLPIVHSNGASLSAGGVWTNASSRSLKQDINELQSDAAMSALRGLDPVTYSYKIDPNEHHVGFIAEDVPQLVATQDRKSLSPMDIVAVLTKVVQDQQKTIEELNARVNQLEKK